MGAGAQEKPDLNPAAPEGHNRGGYQVRREIAEGGISAVGEVEAARQWCWGEKNGRVRCVESMLRGQPGCGASTSSAEEALGHSWGNQRGREPLRSALQVHDYWKRLPSTEAEVGVPQGMGVTLLVDTLISDQSE